MHRLVLVLCNVLAETYACVELFLRFAGCELRDNIDRATRTVILGYKAGRFAYVSSASATGRELVESRRFALRTFACDSSVHINSVIVADVASACCESVTELEVELPVQAHRTSTACRVDWGSGHADLLIVAIQRTVFCDRSGECRVFRAERTGVQLHLIFALSLRRSIPKNDAITSRAPPEPYQSFSAG